MQKQQKIILTAILSGLVIFSGVAIYLVSLDPFTISQFNFDTKVDADIEPGAQRLSFQLDTSQNRHFIYQLGDRPRVEPSTEPYNGTHVLKYAILIGNKFSSENVTDELVFPYHYEFRVDSLGRVHIAYITGNYTLFYAVRDPITETWNSTQLNTPSQMFASMPSITLGTDEQPRLVYTVTFKEDGNEFFNQGDSDSLRGVSSLFYAVLNGSSWLYFDVGDNHNSFFARDINFQRIFNPGIKIKDEIAYIAFTNKVSLAVETRLQYIKIPEIPTDTAFFAKIHKRAKIGLSQATTYRRPSIHIIGDGVLLAFAAWSSGGGSVIYLTNSSATESTNPAIAKHEWLKASLLPDNKINKQLDSVVGVQDNNGTLFLTWSFYDLFNAETLAFAHDVFLASFKPTSTEIGDIRVERVTDTTQISHYSPSIAVTEDNIIELYYIRDNNLVFDLVKSEFGGIGLAFEDEGLALTISLGLIGVFVATTVIVIRLIPKPEEDLLILPHMINLKDSITEH